MIVPPLRSQLGLWLCAASVALPSLGCITPARIAEVDAAELARALISPNPESAESSVATNGTPPADVVSSTENLVPEEELSGADNRFIVQSEAAQSQEELAEPTPRPGAFEEIQPGPIVSPNVGTSFPVRDIRNISLDIAPPPLVDDRGQPLPAPADYATADFAAAPSLERNVLLGFSDAVGIAPAGLEFCYQPLYFEEVNLERYGRSFGILQPVVSGGQFYTRTALLPYHVFAQPARRCTWHPHWTLPGYRIPCRE
jgi:hypothetical protein